MIKADQVVGSPAQIIKGNTMTLRRLLAVSCLLFPLMASAHNFVDGQRVAPVGVADRGELVLNNDKFSYKSWNSAQLVGKVRVVQHIAGRSSAKEKNATLIEAIKSAKLPHDRYQTTTIVNTDDAIPGSGMFVRSSIESNKQLYPWSQFIVDSNGVVRKAWQLNEESSAIVVLDKDGRVQWAKDGALSQEEVQQVVALLHKLLNK
jgi:YtfJ family uncharacterized protein